MLDHCTQITRGDIALLCALFHGALLQEFSRRVLAQVNSEVHMPKKKLKLQA